MDIKKQFTEKPIATVSMIVGIITGFIAIIAFVANVWTIADTYIVSESELAESEARIIAQIRQEAVITRDVIIGEILARKHTLQRRLETAESEGEIATILQQIEELNQRLDRIKGITK